MGWGSLEELPRLSKDLGERILLVTGRSAMKRSGILDRVTKLLMDVNQIILVFDQVEPEPHWDTVNNGVRLAKDKECQVIIGLGGGSVLDTAKAIAGIANKKTSVEEYQTGQKLEFSGLPYIAIPTTSGTGAEVTPNAVLINKKKGIKKSFRDPLLSAKVAIIDPELTIFLPPKITAYSGMDALCQAIESFVSLGSNPITDNLCLGAIRLIGRSLLKSYRNGRDIQARTDMSYGSVLGGIALFNARMGIVHGIVHPLGVKYGLSHGLLCGLLLPHAMEFNLNVAEEKYNQLAPLLGGKDAKGCISRIRELLSNLDFPKSLGELGVKEEDFSDIARESMPSGSLKANPRKVTEKDVIKILRKAS